jgi:hypothetical protein
MTCRLAIGLLAAAVFTGSAVAGPNDPKKRYNAADQAWARRIRIHRADLPGTGWKVEPSKDDSDYAPKGCRSPNLSDLVTTGEASNPDFTRGGSFVGSGSSVFATERQASAAWIRMAKVPVGRCLVAALREGMAGSGATLTVRSNRQVRRGLAPHESAFSVGFVASGPAAKIDGRIGYYVFARGRAIGAVMVISLGKPLQPVPLALEQKLAGLVASRLRR